MRCQSCNVALSDFESTRKHAETKEFIDLCNTCYAYVRDDVITIERNDLRTEEVDLELEGDTFN